MSRTHKDLAADITVAYLHAAGNVSSDYDKQALIKAETVAKFYATVFDAITDPGSIQSEEDEENEEEESKKAAMELLSKARVYST